jgi:hypothetical protein
MGKASGGRGEYGLAQTRSGKNSSAAPREDDEGECHQHGADDHLPLGVRGSCRQHDALLRLTDSGNRRRRAPHGDPSAAVTLLRPTLDRCRGGNRLRSVAEDLLEVPARRQVERQFAHLQRLARRTGHGLVDGDQAGQPRHQLMLERERENRLVGFIHRQRAHALRDFRVRDLAPCPEL